MVIWIWVYAILLNKIRTAMMINVSVLPKKLFLPVKLMSVVFFDGIYNRNIPKKIII